ncbi:hypothetical protein E2C01_019789 [Portunus trituberculatus]|uniref:Uncharacterized protein n=1 Tax=Portunus trituberculatus TaxID=210409 RepID=A0A5B7E0C9_PORTR|nr:hypothetical protein [Portunus trituberculatus]
MALTRNVNNNNYMIAGTGALVRRFGVINYCCLAHQPQPVSPSAHLAFTSHALTSPSKLLPRPTSRDKRINCFMVQSAQVRTGVAMQEGRGGGGDGGGM